MTTINAATKQGQHYLTAYRHSHYRTLSDCYGRYSAEKYIAERDCRAMMAKEGGSDFRILTFNQSFFTCGWRTPEGNFRVETHCNSFLIK